MHCIAYCTIVCCMLLAPGWGEAVRAWRPDLRRVCRCPQWRQVRSVLLCQRDLPAVLLWAMLGAYPLRAGTRVPQAACQGGRRPAPRDAFPLVLRLMCGGCGSCGLPLELIYGLPETDRLLLFSVGHHFVKLPHPLSNDTEYLFWNRPVYACAIQALWFRYVGTRTELMHPAVKTYLWFSRNLSFLSPPRWHVPHRPWIYNQLHCIRTALYFCST